MPRLWSAPATRTRHGQQQHCRWHQVVWAITSRLVTRKPVLPALIQSVNRLCSRARLCTGRIRDENDGRERWRDGWLLTNSLTGLLEAGQVWQNGDEKGSDIRIASPFVYGGFVAALWVECSTKSVQKKNPIVSQEGALNASLHQTSFFFLEVFSCSESWPIKIL